MREPSWGPVGSYVRDQVQVIVTRRDDVLRNAPDAVHATRVACRRLRSTLRTFRPLWRPRHRMLLDELRWYGRLLGDPRDTEVLEEGLLALVEAAATRGAAGTDELAARLRDRLDGDRDRGLATLYDSMATDRFEGLLTRAARCATTPRWDRLADVPAERLLPGLAYGAVVPVVAAADRLPGPGPARAAALHEVRKRAKAARYGYEAFGAPAVRAAATWKQVTESLGRAQDGVVGLTLLDDLRQAAAAAGEPTEAYDAVAAALREQVAAGERDGLAALETAVGDAP